MWLFDDLLKKPTPPADPLASTMWTTGGGQPPADDTTVVAPMPKFVIEKSEATTIFWPKSEQITVDAQNASPAEPTIYAENDSASILVWGTPEPLVETPIVTAMSTPISFMTEPSSLTPSVATDNFSVPSVVVETPVVASDKWSTDDLFSQITSTTPVVKDESKMEISSEWISFAIPETVTEVPVEITPINTTEGDVFSSPKEFIEKSLESITLMVDKIDMKHDAKIEEALWYGKEKDRYTDLEKQAYAEAEIMDKEKDHTLRMRKILEKERSLDTLLEETPKKETPSRGGGLTKVKEASKKEVDEAEALVGL